MKDLVDLFGSWECEDYPMNDDGEFDWDSYYPVDKSIDGGIDEVFTVEE